jgi:hypothetical protein
VIFSTMMLMIVQHIPARLSVQQMRVQELFVAQSTARSGGFKPSRAPVWSNRGFRPIQGAGVV